MVGQSLWSCCGPTPTLTGLNECGQGDVRPHKQKLGGKHREVLILIHDLKYCENHENADLATLFFLFIPPLWSKVLTVVWVGQEDWD